MKTVIFDIGYVLVHYDWDEYLHTLFSDEHTIAVVKDALYNHGVWNELDRGVWTEEQLKAGFVAPAPDYEKEILGGLLLQPDGPGVPHGTPRQD